MKKFLKEHYKLIIAPVIATLLAAFILWMLTKVSIFSSLLSFFYKKITVPIYIVLLILLLGISLPFIIRFLLKKRTHSKTYEYDRDEVNGLVWEWCNLVIPRRFKPLCPRCLAELPIRNYNQTEYLCVSCGFSKEYDYQHGVMLKLVEIEVEKRKRTEEWKDSEKRINEIKKQTMKQQFDTNQD